MAIVKLLLRPVIELLERLVGPKLYAGSVDYPFLVNGYVARRLARGRIDDALAYARRIPDAPSRDWAYAAIADAMSEAGEITQAEALRAEIEDLNNVLDHPDPNA